MNYCLAIIHVGSFECLRKLDCIWLCSRAGSSWKPLPRVTQVTCLKFYGRTAHTHTRWAPLTTISGFIPSYTHIQPWLKRVCWGYNYLITRGGALLACVFWAWEYWSTHLRSETWVHSIFRMHFLVKDFFFSEFRGVILEGNPNIWVVNLTEKKAKSPNYWRPWGGGIFPKYTLIITRAALSSQM